jgi:hypothetical protein
LLELVESSSQIGIFLSALHLQIIDLMDIASFFFPQQAQLFAQGPIFLQSVLQLSSYLLLLFADSGEVGVELSFEFVRDFEEFVAFGDGVEIDVFEFIEGGLEVGDFDDVLLGVVWLRSCLVELCLQSLNNLIFFVALSVLMFDHFIQPLELSRQNCYLILVLSQMTQS